MSPLDGVWRTIRRYDLLPAGTRVIVAVSGGADSVALLHLLVELAPRGPFVVAGLAHVNHQLRGSDSDEDEAFCRGLADSLGLPSHVERVGVRQAATAEGRSLEDAGRRARYAALERARQALGADRVAVGHTRDDQAETVLLKLFRGAGPRGLAGIYPRRGAIVRPLLELSRTQVRTWLADKGITHVEDATNADVRNPRNLVRHEVLPALQTWFGPSVSEVLSRTAEIARADEDWLAELTASQIPRLVRAEGEAIRIDAGATAVPLALERRVLLEALRRAGVRHPGLAEVEALRSLLAGELTAVELPGRVRADRNGAGVVLSSTAARATGAQAFRYLLPIPGRVWVPEAGVMVLAETAPNDGSRPGGTPAAPAVTVAAERVSGGLAVRNWRPGDALKPVGLGGRKKLQDLFVDRKVDRRDRHRLPLIVDGSDRVVWLPGLALDEAYTVTAADEGVVVLRLTRQWGGPE